jgi:outer membrane lipoprotein SlyB
VFRPASWWFRAAKSALLILSGLCEGLTSQDCFAQQLLRVSEAAWVGLNFEERAVVQRNFVVTLFEQNSFGTIIDNQAINESRPGTTGGAALGGAIGNAAYIDNALKGGNYSAKSQLASGVMGAMLGSALDSAPESRFHFRYAVRLASGEVKYFDQVKGDAFRHPVGVCVSVPSIQLTDQQLCAQTTASLRAAYVPGYPETRTSVPSLIGAQVNGDLRQVPIQVGDTISVSRGAMFGYRTPSISGLRIRKFDAGATFEVVALIKDFAQVKTTKGDLVWVEMREIFNVGAVHSVSVAARSAHAAPETTDMDVASTGARDATASNAITPRPRMINCKIGALAPVTTTQEKCGMVNGILIE